MLDVGRRLVVVLILEARPADRSRGRKVGSWKVPFRFFACIGTLNRRGGCAAAIASWSAAVLCRFCVPRPDRKAPEDWRSPKPGGLGSVRGARPSRVHRRGESARSLLNFKPIVRKLAARPCRPTMRRNQRGKLIGTNIMDHIEETLVLIKPDALERGLVGEIIRRFEAAGLRIQNIRWASLSRALLEKHYADLNSKSVIWSEKMPSPLSSPARTPSGRCGC